MPWKTVSQSSKSQWLYICHQGNWYALFVERLSDSGALSS